ncbi:MAG: 2-hydroxyacyl-CoA dehydratase family protein [Acidobacteriota bacterium]
MGPPLKCAAATKRLVTRHYLDGRYVRHYGKTAWVTSGAPVELLKALGFFVLYPENHGALCGARRAAEALCRESEAAGYSSDICSYARTDLGSLLSGRTPVGRLPRPDVLVCCTNICQTVLAWYRVLSDHFNAPLLVVDTPFLYAEAPPHAKAYVLAQIEAMVEPLERIAGRSLNQDRLKRTVKYSRDAAELWNRITEMGRRKPAPLTAFDQFIHMAPIVEMRGDSRTVDFYAAMLRELEERARLGIGAVQRERARLVWDNLPVWHQLRFLSEFFAEKGAAVVAATYTKAWGELAPLLQESQPFEAMADTYLHVLLNRGTGSKLDTIRALVKEFDADGVVFHSDRSCKPYSIGQMGQRDSVVRQDGIPALLLEADHNDPRSWSRSQNINRLEAFMEVVAR